MQMDKHNCRGILWDGYDSRHLHVRSCRAILLASGGGHYCHGKKFCLHATLATSYQLTRA